MSRQRRITHDDLVWAAGLFEGEGTITIARRGQDDTYRLVVTISNTDVEIIDFFCERWEGWKQPAYGERPGRQPAWTWTVAGPRAARFLEHVERYIRTARVRRKLELGLEFREHQSRLKRVQRDPVYKETQRELYAAMRELNRRGVQEEAAA